MTPTMEISPLSKVNLALRLTQYQLYFCIEPRIPCLPQTPEKAAFQHQFFLLPSSGLLKLHNTLTWKFSRPFSALDWNNSILFYFFFQVKNNNWKVFVEVGLFSQGAEMICVANEEGRLIFSSYCDLASVQAGQGSLHKRIVPSSTCGISIFQVITSPPHFLKWVKE